MPEKGIGYKLLDILKKTISIWSGLLIAILGGIINWHLTPSDTRSGWNNLLFSILLFFFGERVADIIFQLKKQKDAAQSVSLEDPENFIIGFLNHLTDNCYGKCSDPKLCFTCDRNSGNCDPLLRQYLFKDSLQFKAAIEKAKNGEYDLDTNIDTYHTLAVTHLIKSKSEYYSVVQWCYSFSDNSIANYDFLDFHFLYTLIKEINKKDKKINFKIRWLLIGNIDDMKNNFDYIFIVINSENFYKDVKEYFEFYFLSKEDYNRNTQNRIVTNNKNGADLLNLKGEPSFGIFGSDFLFVDSTKIGHHGTIYTNKYKHNSDEQTILDIANNFFNELIMRKNKEDIDNINEKYNNILKEDPIWESILKKRWGIIKREK